MILTLIV